MKNDNDNYVVLAILILLFIGLLFAYAFLGSSLGFDDGPRGYVE